MDNKYYTPTIEEFHIGFEYEYFEPVNNTGWVKAEIHFFDEHNTTQDLHDNLKEGVHRPIRVKYLDGEDIESLGWAIREDNTKLLVLDYEKPFTNCDRKIHNKVFIHYNLVSKWGLITTGNRNYTHEDEDKLDKAITRFCGYIKNKSELIKLMKQLNIK